MVANILLAFWSVSILFVITPGVDWSYAISAGIRGKSIFPAVLGLLTGHFIATLLVATGVGAILSEYPHVLMVLTVLGAIYLLWIGINLLLHSAVGLKSSDHASEMNTHQSWFIKGLCISGLNPKVFLFFLALLPQFIDHTSSWLISVQILLLGLIHILNCFVVYIAVGFSAQKLLKARPKVTQIVSHISGLLMILIAIFLIFEQF